MRKIHTLLFAGFAASSHFSLELQATPKTVIASRQTDVLPRAKLATQHFGNDAPWFSRNIPFFSCSDPQIEQIYYYRWQLWKSHLKDLGDRGHIVTEFLDDVSWSLKPYESLNDATGFHISEGRWLRDRRYTNETIDFMYHGGNDRHFSEAIADASYDHFLVNGDRSFALKNLEEMKRLYRAWDDRLDVSKGLYWIEPLADATEYTISSIDASGAKDGFRGGDAFRPSINSFMFANARAISQMAAMQGDLKTSQEYAAKAAKLRELMQRDLWNEGMGHFIDRYKVNNEFVRTWDFIRGRELAGYTPWYFGVPDKNPKWVGAWQHILAPDRLGGRFGIRTLEPSYEHYMRQYRYLREDGINKPECQWNGPSWPFQTTLALGGLANLLNDYPKQNTIGAGDYVRLLRQYTQQHYAENGQPDLQEDYNPDTGKVIVGLNRSHHYNHSGYNDLVISGLVGLRPRADEVLEVNPLVPATGPNSLAYFCLENVLYHGREITILYDRDGKRFGKGAGLSIYADGKQILKPSPLGKRTVMLPSLAMAKRGPSAPIPANLAVNVARRGFPAPAASAGGDPRDWYQAVDGRVWFYPNVRNYWANSGSTQKSDWFSLDFETPQTFNSARLYFYGDGAKFKAPESVTMQSWKGGDWANIPNSTIKPLENGETVVNFSPLQTSKLRAVFSNPQNASVALVEMKAFGTKTVAPRLLQDPARVGGLPARLENLQSQSSQSGEFNQRRWRDATQGGFFEFDIPTVPDSANSLVVTYWGGEAPVGVSTRDFEVLASGVKIGEQKLQNNRPGQFFEVSYPIPVELTQNKAKITVRFQAKPNSIAGGVFGVKLVKGAE